MPIGRLRDSSASWRRSAGRSTAWESSTFRLIRPKRAAARNACSGPLQDRLIKELAKQGLNEIETPKAWIRDVYVPDHNVRFGRPAAVPEIAFVTVRDTATLAETLCVQDSRRVLPLSIASSLQRALFY